MPYYIGLVTLVLLFAVPLITQDTELVGCGRLQWRYEHNDIYPHTIDYDATMIMHVACLYNVRDLAVLWGNMSMSRLENVFVVSHAPSPRMWVFEVACGAIMFACFAWDITRNQERDRTTPLTPLEESTLALWG